MSGALTKLTLICPTMAADQIVEALLEAGGLVDGFTTAAVNGHGQDFASASVGERVRGYVRRTSITLVTTAERTTALVALLRGKFPSPHIVYWTEPVMEFGDFS